MELRIVVTPKLLEEAIVCLMEAKFNTKITESCIIIAESCNLTEAGGVTAVLTTGENPVIKEPVYEDDVWQAQSAKYAFLSGNTVSVPPEQLDEWQKAQQTIVEEQEELRRFRAQNPEW